MISSCSLTLTHTGDKPKAPTNTRGTGCHFKKVSCHFEWAARKCFAGLFQFPPRPRLSPSVWFARVPSPWIRQGIRQKRRNNTWGTGRYLKKSKLSFWASCEEVFRQFVFIPFFLTSLFHLFFFLESLRERVWKFPTKGGGSYVPVTDISFCSACLLPFSSVPTFLT